MYLEIWQLVLVGWLCFVSGVFVMAFLCAAGKDKL